MSKKVEVIAIELFFALRTSKRSQLQHIKKVYQNQQLQTRQKHIFGNQNWIYFIELFFEGLYFSKNLNNSATERNIEMQEVLICLCSWSVYVLNPL